MIIEVTQALVQYREALMNADYESAYQLIVPFSSHGDKRIAGYACYFTGLCLIPKGDLALAGEWFDKSVALGCDQPGLYEVYAPLLIQRGDNLKARAVLEAGLKFCGPSASLLAHQAGISTQLGDLVAAEKLLDSALALDQENTLVWNNLGHLQGVMGRVQQSQSSFQKALAIDSSNEVSLANLLLALNYLPLPKGTVYQAHNLHASRINACAVVTRDKVRKPGKIRVGYISSDVRFHAVALFFIPLLMHHDREKFELYCYIDNLSHDDVTQLVKSNAFATCDVCFWTDKQLAERIVEDGIDILVDLTGHSRGRRLPLFKSRPAPVQISYLGYPNTLGILEIDYRIVDSITDPEGEDDHHFHEKLKRIGPPFLCFSPVKDLPEVAPLPALTNGYITFGSLNRLEKMSESAVALWSELLVKTPGSRLYLKSKMFTHPEVAGEILTRFERRGVSSERIILGSWTSGYVDHLRTYRHIDIALDTFPYNGTTTSCEALIMGVPVVTLKGDRHAARVSASILHSLKLESLVAESPAQFIAIAEGLAQNPVELSKMRRELRQRVLSSPLTDGRRLAAELEAFYQTLV